jgi:hypothetical protein
LEILLSWKSSTSTLTYISSRSIQHAQQLLRLCAGLHSQETPCLQNRTPLDWVCLQSELLDQALGPHSLEDYVATRLGSSLLRHLEEVPGLILSSQCYLAALGLERSSRLTSWPAYLPVYYSFLQLKSSQCDGDDYQATIRLELEKTKQLLISSLDCKPEEQMLVHHLHQDVPYVLNQLMYSPKHQLSKSW